MREEILNKECLPHLGLCHTSVCSFYLRLPCIDKLLGYEDAH
jgi:hypothetical protein